MDVYAGGAGFLVQALFLFGGHIEQPADNAAGQYDSAEPHIDQRHGQRAKYKPRQYGAQSPIDVFPFKGFIYKGPLEPLIYLEFARH